MDAELVERARRGGEAAFPTLSLVICDRVHTIEGAIETASAEVRGTAPHGSDGMGVAPKGTLVIADGGGGRIVGTASEWTVSFVAGPGTGVAGRTSEDEPATDADVHPTHVTVGMDGSLSIDDLPGVRLVAPTGAITTVAGSGKRGYLGDAGPVLGATFQDPGGLAFDDAGNVYIPDHQANVVRKVDTSGIITTVAGSVSRTEVASADCGPVTEVHMQPWAIAIHDGYLYIDDMASDRIRVVKL